MYRCKESGLSELTFRHVYRQDWVPTLPPLDTGLFLHVGKEFRGTRTKSWSQSLVPVLPSWSAFTTLPVALLAFAFQQLPLLRRLPLPNSLADHIPQNYVDCSALTVILLNRRAPDVP